MEKSVTEKNQIKHMTRKRKTAIESLDPEQMLKVEGLIDAIESTWLDEFMEYIRSPWRMFWPNLFAGVVRGVGAVIGAVFVIAIIGWFLSTLIDLPLIGKKLEPYVSKVQYEIDMYKEATNYTPHFYRMEDSLSEIVNLLRKETHSWSTYP